MALYEKVHSLIWSGLRISFGNIIIANHNLDSFGLHTSVTMSRGRSVDLVTWVLVEYLQESVIREREYQT